MWSALGIVNDERERFYDTLRLEIRITGAGEYGPRRDAEEVDKLAVRDSLALSALEVAATNSDQCDQVIAAGTKLRSSRATNSLDAFGVVWREVVIRCGTHHACGRLKSRISDPAPVTPDMQLRCIAGLLHPVCWARQCAA